MGCDMRYFTYRTTTGAITGWTDALVKPPMMAGYDAVAGDASVVDPMGTLYVTPQGAVAARTLVTKLPATGWVSVDGADPVSVAQAPTSGDHVLVLVGAYRGTIMMVSLAAAQATRWAAAKAYRATRRTGGCSTALGRVQTDMASREAITSAATDATNSKLALPSWSIDWTMEDNSIKTHNATQMIAMATAVRIYTNACQTASQTIRKAIYATTTTAAVATVDITAGYPA